MPAVSPNITLTEPLGELTAPPPDPLAELRENERGDTEREEGERGREVEGRANPLNINRYVKTSRLNWPRGPRRFVISSVDLGLGLGTLCLKLLASTSNFKNI